MTWCSWFYVFVKPSSLTSFIIQHSTETLQHVNKVVSFQVFLILISRNFCDIFCFSEKHVLMLRMYRCQQVWHPTTAKCKVVGLMFFAFPVRQQRAIKVFRVKLVQVKNGKIPLVRFLFHWVVWSHQRKAALFFCPAITCADPKQYLP